MKRIASPGSVHDTGCSGLVHWDVPEGWDRKGGVGEVGFQDGGTHVHPWLIHVEDGKNHHDVSSNYPPIKISKLIKKFKSDIFFCI